MTYGIDALCKEWQHGMGGIPHYQSFALDVVRRTLKKKTQSQITELIKKRHNYE